MLLQVAIQAVRLRRNGVGQCLTIGQQGYGPYGTVQCQIGTFSGDLPCITDFIHDLDLQSVAWVGPAPALSGNNKCRRIDRGGIVRDSVFSCTFS
jgi:hypothetical protein